MLSLKDECSLRFGVEYNMPVGIELKIGTNWSDLKEVGVYERT